MRKGKTNDLKPHVVIFVEGDTDEVFFGRLINYYRKVSETPLYSCEIQNLKGVSRYSSSKFTGKLKAEIIPRAEHKGERVYAVCCSYDTDVFEDEETPVVDWQKVEKSIIRMGIEQFCRIEVKSAIEDWLLDDLEGLCSYLNLKEVPKSLKGANGYTKLLSLFHKTGKVYAKGITIENFIDKLSMEKIRNKRKTALKQLEEILNVTLHI